MLRPAAQPRVSETEQRLGDRPGAEVDHRAVGEHHEEGMSHLGVLVMYVAIQIDARIALERVGEVVGDGLREPVRRLAR